MVMSCPTLSPFSGFQWLSPDEIRDFDLTRLNHNQQVGIFSILI